MRFDLSKAYVLATGNLALLKKKYSYDNMLLGDFPTELFADTQHMKWTTKMLS